MESERNNNQKKEWSTPELKAIMMDATEGGVLPSTTEMSLGILS